MLRAEHSGDEHDDRAIGATALPIAQAMPHSDAQQLVAMLYGDACAHCHFQAVPEDIERTGPNAPPRVIEGALTDCWQELQRLNLDGYGIHIAISSIRPGDQRIASNVQRRVAVWSDIDRQISPEKLRELADAMALPPSLIDETSDWKYHLMWLIGDNCTVATWQQIMNGIHAVLAPHGADSQAIDIVRVLRLPGTIHQKLGKPFRCRIIPDMTTSDVYTAEELLEAFPAPFVEPKPRRRQDEGAQRYTAGETVKEPSDHDNLIGALKALDDRQARDGPFTVHSGSPKDAPLLIDMRKRDWWLRTGMAIHHAYSGSDQGRQLWESISGGGQVRRSDGAVVAFQGRPDCYDDGDQNRTWHQFKDPARYTGNPITIRTICWAAYEGCGWRAAGTRGRKPGAPRRPQVSNSIQPVRDAAADTIAIGYPSFVEVWLQAVDELYARHPLKRRLCHLLRSRIDPATSIGAYAGPKELSSHDRIKNKPDTTKRAVTDIVRDGLIIKSNGNEFAGPGLGKGVLFALALPNTQSHLLSGVRINRPEGAYAPSVPLPTTPPINNNNCLLATHPPTMSAAGYPSETDHSKPDWSNHPPTPHACSIASSGQKEAALQQHVPVRHYDEFLRLLVAGGYLSADIGAVLRQATESWLDAIGERVRLLAALVRLLRLEVKPYQTSQTVDGYVAASCSRQRVPLDHLNPRGLIRGLTSKINAHCATQAADRAEAYHSGHIRIGGEVMPIPLVDGLAPPLPTPAPKPKKQRSSRLTPRRPNHGTPERVVFDALADGALGWAVLAERIANHPPFAGKSRGDAFNALRDVVANLEKRALVKSDDAEVTPANKGAPGCSARAITSAKPMGYASSCPGSRSVTRSWIGPS